jgi:hypothetical protein
MPRHRCRYGGGHFSCCGGRVGGGGGCVGGGGVGGGGQVDGGGGCGGRVGGRVDVSYSVATGYNRSFTGSHNFLECRQPATTTDPRLGQLQPKVRLPSVRFGWVHGLFSVLCTGLSNTIKDGRGTECSTSSITQEGAQFVQLMACT